MANLVPINVPGKFNQESHQFTLVGGTLTLQTQLKRWRPVGIVPYAAASIVAEGIGIIGTPDSGGYFGGDVVLKSSGGGSTTSGILTIQGYS